HPSPASLPSYRRWDRPLPLLPPARPRIVAWPSYRGKGSQSFLADNPRCSRPTQTMLADPRQQNKYGARSRYPLAGGVYCTGNSAGPTIVSDLYRSFSTKTNRLARPAFLPAAPRTSAYSFRSRDRGPPAGLAPVPAGLAPAARAAPPAAA